MCFISIQQDRMKEQSSSVQRTGTRDLQLSQEKEQQKNNKNNNKKHIMAV
jgi:hypothetical protein